MAAYTTWRKSSYSSSNGGDCVEVANTLGALRDSKNTSGPHLDGRVDLLIAALKSAPAFGSCTSHG